MNKEEKEVKNYHEGGQREKRTKKKKVKKEMSLSDSTGWMAGSIFGGCLTTVLALIMILLCTQGFLTIWEGRDAEMVKKMDMFDD